MNKKFLFSLLLIGLLAVQFAPMVVLAACDSPHDEHSCPLDPQGCEWDSATGTCIPAGGGGGGGGSAEDEGIPSECTIRTDVKNRLMDGCPPKKNENEGIPGTCSYDEGSTYYYDGVCGICCLLSSILYVTDLVFMGLIALVVVFVLLGAFTIVTAAGASEKVNTGRNYILYAGVGLAAALLARAVPALVKYIIG